MHIKDNKIKRVGIIPLRKGSKSIINKNKKKLLGRPLFAWCLCEAIFSNLDQIYIYTDDEDIIKYVADEYKWTTKVKALRRSVESAIDTASTEFAMIEFTGKIQNNYDILCLLQATSPLITRNDINEALNRIEKSNFDSCLSVVKYKRFFWNKEGNSINYDFKNRPRRQDFEGTLIENGAVYATTKEQFIKTNNRLGGKIGIVEMLEDTLTEIDEPNDWIIVEDLIKNRLKISKGQPVPIKVLVLDVDGVFTRGNITYSNDGEFSKEFNMQDGMGFEFLRESKIPVIIMTSENSNIVAHRMKKLNIDNIYLGVKDKYSLLEKILTNMDLERNDVAYIGDDINDLSNICSVGWGICPYNAMDIVKQESDLVLNNSGGYKAIREAIHFIINYNKRF